MGSNTDSPVAPEADPRGVSGKEMPQRPRNAEVREREYLTADEVEALIAAARSVGRHGYRDSTLLLVAYRHGLRNQEVCGLRWRQVEWGPPARLHVKRVKNGRNGVHPIEGRELRALRRLAKLYPGTEYVFASERGTPLTTSGVRKMVARAGERAGLPFPVHPHMLRHACGFYLANKGVETRAIQEYLGHADISHTVVYTELVADRFAGFWE